MKLALLLWIFLLAAPAAEAEATEHDARVLVRAPDGSEKTLDWTRLASIPHRTETALNHDKSHRYDVVSLLLVLQAAGIEPTESLRGHMLGRVVTVQGADGYRAVFALSELDPTIGGKLVLLTAREDGQPLPVDDGPLRLVVPSDKRPARWVRQVVRIVVSDVPDTATRVPDTADHPPVAK